ncbi:sm-like protein LSM7 [Carica papaya]|uniref:sm-like protein LSM7 n=1 Tax=Carica papaya TaxID=3649 RepID=UPI000B8D1A18|nr:sm-like protein LSM7 [Carica papaya]
MSGRKETVLDLAKFVDKGVQVKLTGGRQVTGTLKGYDQLLNLVLDEAVEFLRVNVLMQLGRGSFSFDPFLDMDHQCQRDV